MCSYPCFFGFPMGCSFCGVCAQARLLQKPGKGLYRVGLTFVKFYYLARADIQVCNTQSSIVNRRKA